MALAKKKKKKVLDIEETVEVKPDIIKEVREAYNNKTPTLVELNAQAKAGEIARKKLAEEK